MAEIIWDGKYKDGKRAGPVRIQLPFQTVETVNESAQDRRKALDLFTTGKPTEWRNRLIWGDKKYVLPSLMPEFAGKIDLIYIDPPFDTGADFSFTTEIPESTEELTKQPSMIEQKAYRDTWGVSNKDKKRGVTPLDKYLRWFFDTVSLLRDLLSDTGSIYVHLDWHVGHYAKAVLDEVFGPEAFTNEIVWYYYNKFQGNVNRFASNHDVILYYRRSSGFTFHQQIELRDEPVKQLKRVWDKKTGRIVNAKDADGHVIYQDVVDKTVDDVWRIPMLQPADRTENVRYPTQKREALLERIIKASSNEGDVVLDCFCGSGTAAVVAEKLGRRWIAADLGRFAIHTTRKRLLGIPRVKPFVVQNLGKYERQAWMKAEFERPDDRAATEAAYRAFILDLFKAEPIRGSAWLHGIKAGRLVHIGAVDAPVTLADVKVIAREVWKMDAGADASGATAAADILGWDFAFELNETAKQQAAEARVDLRFRRIPREVLEKAAVEQGDISAKDFFELRALSTRVAKTKRSVTVSLTDFIMPSEDLPSDVAKAIKHWSQWVDYWAVDWDYRNDTFHNQWQAFRSREHPELELEAKHEYQGAGTYEVVVKVIDLLGNDTTKSLTVEVKQ